MIEQGIDPDDNGFPEREEIIVIEDMSIENLVAAVDEETGAKPFIGSFILLGFPKTEVHCNKLKMHGLDFDRVICITDQTEEDPGKALFERNQVINPEVNYDWEEENAKVQKVMAVVKEHMIPEEVVDVVYKEVDCTGDADKVFIKLRT